MPDKWPGGAKSTLLRERPGGSPTTAGAAARAVWPDPALEVRVTHLDTRNTAKSHSSGSRTFPSDDSTQGGMPDPSHGGHGI